VTPSSGRDRSRQHPRHSWFLYNSACIQ